MTDDIIEEVRRVREAYGAAFEFDLRAIGRDLKEQEQRGGRAVVSRPARPAQPADANAERVDPEEGH